MYAFTYRPLPPPMKGGIAQSIYLITPQEAVAVGVELVTQDSGRASSVVGTPVTVVSASAVVATEEGFIVREDPVRVVEVSNCQRLYLDIPTGMEPGIYNVTFATVSDGEQVAAPPIRLLVTP